MKRFAFLWAVAVVTACGGNGSPTSPVADQPYSQTVPGTVSAFGSTRHAVSIPRSGNLTLRLTWNDPTVDLDLYLTSPNCTANLYPKENCGILLASDAGSGTIETIARSVNSGDQYQVWVDNLNLTKPMTYTLAVTIN